MANSLGKNPAIVVRINRLFAVVCTLSALLLGGNTSRAIVGATTPFISYEAEDGAPGGGASIVSVTSAPTTPYSSPELEASGHAYVKLDTTGESVTWTNNTGQNITALNLRSCIPDAPTGGGITSTIDLYVNGVFRQAFSVNSLQNYCYEGTNYNGQVDKNPADGNPRGFWNDTHEFVAGAPIAPGDTITFQKDAANSASFYYIDVLDVENPPAPLSQPPNSLSILDYGAVSNNISVDNTTAINNCFLAAQSQGKIAWIPPGTFYFSAIHGGLHASGITIQGAGAWYSTLYRVTPSNNSQGVANMITTTSSTLRGVLLDCDGADRAGNHNNGAINFSGNNWLVDNVWIQHATSAFWCAGINGAAQNCRVLSVWSDGGNFNNVQSDNGIGMNLTYSNNFVRGTGDDAMAINSVNYDVFGSTTYYYTMMSNITYINNTAVGAWGGKGIGIYGGINDVVTNNLLRDTARYIGLGVGKFGVNGSDLVSATVEGNLVLRCGGNGYSQQQPAMMIGNGGDGQSSGSVANAYCASNTVINALYSGIGFTASTNIVLQYNTVISPGQHGVTVGGGSLGTGVIGNAIIHLNPVSGLKPGYSALTNQAPGYASIIPTEAANYVAANGVIVQPCGEGGQEIVAYASTWSAYSSVNLTGSDTFVSRVSSQGAGNSIEIHLDGPSGTLIGTCTVPNTGGAQVYLDTYCDISGASGTHTLYLVFTGVSPFSLELFGFYSAPPIQSHQLIIGDVYALKSLVNGKYVTAPNNGSNSLVAQSTTIGTAEQFRVFDAGGGNLSFRSMVNTQYVCAENNGASPLIANRSSVGSWETFTEFDAGNGNIALRAMNDGKFVTAPNGGNSALIAQSSAIGTAESFSPEFVSGFLPSAPANLVITPGNARANLSWVLSTGATSYNIQRAISLAGPYTTIATNLPGPTYTDTNLVNGTTYYYGVFAVNAIGQSAGSAQNYVMPGTLNRLLWVASSSTSGSDSPGNALDGNLSTRWSTGTSQAPGQWFQVDLGAVSTFNKLVLNSVNSANDYPRGYQVFVSNDGVNWGSSLATGVGSSGTTTITFSPQGARYIRIIQTGSASGTFWSIHEFNVFGTAPFTPTSLTANAFGTQANLFWNASAGADGFNVKRAITSGGSYMIVATNQSGLSYSDFALNPGTAYYYVVTATNAFGESGASSQAMAQAVSLVPAPLNLVASGNQLQLTWPTDHLGWHLEMQTNALDGTNWIPIPGTTATNQMSIPATNGNAFFRLVYP